MTRLEPGAVVDAATLPLGVSAVDDAQVVAGAPSTGWASLGELGGVEVGVWEMSAGAMRDVEVDEVFVVLSGSATVAFDEPGLAPVELGPGSLMRLTAGMRTVWTVRETLRKVSLAP